MLIYSVETDRLRTGICEWEAARAPAAPEPAQDECAGRCGCLLGEQYRRREEELRRALCPAERAGILRIDKPSVSLVKYP